MTWGRRTSIEPANRVLRGASRGQSMTEVALVAPMLIFLTLGVSDLGRAFFYKEGVANSARQAIRLAASDQAAGALACSGNGTVTRNLPDAGSDAISRLVNTGALENTSNGLASGSSLNNAVVATTIIFKWHCNGANPYTNTTATSTNPTSPTSDSVEVKVDYSFKLITPLVGGLFSAQTVHIRADEFGRLEY